MERWRGAGDADFFTLYAEQFERHAASIGRCRTIR